jgi:hypothetical protein
MLPAPRAIAHTTALDARRRWNGWVQDRSPALAIFGYSDTSLRSRRWRGLRGAAHWARHRRTTRVHHDAAPQSIAWRARANTVGQHAAKAINKYSMSF